MEPDKKSDNILEDLKNVMPDKLSDLIEIKEALKLVEDKSIRLGDRLGSAVELNKVINNEWHKLDEPDNPFYEESFEISEKLLKALTSEERDHSDQVANAKEPIERGDIPDERNPDVNPLNDLESAGEHPFTEALIEGVSGEKIENRRDNVKEEFHPLTNEEREHSNEVANAKFDQSMSKYNAHAEEWFEEFFEDVVTSIESKFGEVGVNALHHHLEDKFGKDRSDLINDERYNNVLNIIKDNPEKYFEENKLLDLKDNVSNKEALKKKY